MATDVTERYRRALEGIDAALRRHVPHLRGDDRVAWSLAEEVRSMLTPTGIGFAGSAETGARAEPSTSKPGDTTGDLRQFVDLEEVARTARAAAERLRQE